MNGIGNQYFVP